MSGESCTLTATAKSGYTFSCWKNGNTQVSTSSTYTFTVTGKASYTAYFTKASDKLTVPEPTASKGTYTSYVKVSWDSVSGAVKYILKRSTTESYDSATNLATVTSTSYNDSSAEVGRKYYYWVCPVNSSGTGYYNKSRYDYGYRYVEEDNDDDEFTITGSISISYGYNAYYYLKKNGVTITDGNAIKWSWLKYGPTIVPERNGYYLKISNNIRQLSDGTIKVIAEYKGKKYYKYVTIKKGY
jgi:hypothetical protein